ncbi:alpha/beta fold hydrolase [Altererythrobacter litoralis]|uniref:Alpha/beta hydrolase n=1 Tax=Altererythrobacter litoralis TaxID=3113904 RepID=A0ABU7GH91_9SPHN|nr:alpha/beta hydrolase [Erythrobacteraceae bacterium 1XM1-14]
MSATYTDQYWMSPDGLKLHYRDYAGSDERPPVLCLHGLTRNARDFAGLAEHLAGDWRVIVPEMRGRGMSEYAKDSNSYSPVTYVADVEALLAELGITRFVSIGTSMGGLMTMLLAMINPARLAAVVLNDIGAEVDPAGIERIGDYVGQGRSFPTWMHAARALQEEHGKWFPDFAIETWLEMAKRTMVLGQNGRIVFDYDMAIAEPFNQPGGAAPADLWPAFDALANVPLLVLRGELSDILSDASVKAMAARHPGMSSVTVPRVGHAPMLDEPESLAAIDALLAGIE